MNRTIWFSYGLSIIAILISISTIIYDNSSSSLAYIDSGLLIDQYQGMIDSRQAYQNKASSWQANIDTLQNEVTRSIMDYEKEVSKMTDKEKKLSQELIRSKQKQLKDYQQAIQQQAQQEDAVMTQQVLERVNAFIKEYGATHNYKIILGTGQGNILYATDGLDITEEVIKQLNEDYLGI